MEQVAQVGTQGLAKPNMEFTAIIKESCNKSMN